MFDSFYQEYNRLGMKVYQYYLNYRASRDTNPEWMGVAHTQDIQVTREESVLSHI